MAHFLTKVGFERGVLSLSNDRFNAAQVHTMWQALSEGGKIDKYQFRRHFGDLRYTGRQLLTARPSSARADHRAKSTAASAKWEFNLIEKLKGHLRITERPLTEVFQQFEPNADGFIHQTEFRQAIRRLNLGLSAREIDQLMQRIDEDRDGRISFDEFAAKFAMGNCEFEMRIRTKDKLAQLKELLMTHMTSTADAFRFVSAPPSYLSCLV